MRSLTVLSWDNVSCEINQSDTHPDGTGYTEEEFPFTKNLDKLCGYAKKIADEHEVMTGMPTFEPHNAGWSANTATLELHSVRRHLATMTFIWH